ncbi:MAG: DUF5394 family protein [Candidatus Lariskella arthropodorum]|uniref:DUF5394 family protein n=1 Tax=Candidatus Lariskella endosymbiont of Epinotia ramella TaxID=3066224 RepID=UPI0030CC910F
MDAHSLSVALKLLRQINDKIAAGGKLSKEEWNASIPTLSALFDYLVMNMENPNIDSNLLRIVMQILGISMRAVKKKRENEKELEQEEELSEERKKQVIRLIIYEIYKITNPHQLAGETALENFINNVQTRGLEVALQYEGAKNAGMFTKDELENLESHRQSFVEMLKETGFRGKGRGL